MRFRNIVFTLNNYTDDEYNNLLNHKEFKYVIIGKEIGEKGTPHLQRYAELNIDTCLHYFGSLNMSELTMCKEHDNMQTGYCKINYYRLM